MGRDAPVHFDSYRIVHQPYSPSSPDRAAGQQTRPYRGSALLRFLRLRQLPIDVEKSENLILAQLRMREVMLRYSIAAFVVVFGWFAIGAAFSPQGAGSSPIRTTIMLAVAATTIPMALLTARMPLGSMWWSKRAAVRGFNVAFVIYADTGVAIALFTLQNPRVALHATALYAVIGVWVAHFVTPRVVTAHLVATSAIIGVCGYLVWRDGGDTLTVVGATLLSLVATNAIVVVLNNYTREFQLSLAAQHKMANTDPLTGVLNRRGFTQQGPELLALGPAGRYSIAIFDVDHYKLINDRHGHAVGDAILVRVAAAIREAAQAGAVVARIGGDEFAVATCGDAQAVHSIAGQVRSHSAELLAGEQVTVSVGAAVISVRPQHAVDGAVEALVDRLVAYADTALMRSKSAGRDRVTIVDADAQPTQAVRR